jgi:amino acid adenylation domain-containing protein
MVRMHGSTPRLAIINERPTILGGPGLLHKLVSPASDAVAIEFLEHGSKRRVFTYKTLHTLSDRLARTIIKTLEKLEHASPIVPVLLPQCPELYICILAILKAGKAFCPLSLDIPKERFSYIVKDISADIIITSSRHRIGIPEATNVGVLLVDDEISEDDERTESNLPHVDAKDIAYVLYTSGSTGMPKAVSISHRAVTQSLLAHDRHIPQFARFLQFAAPTFDVSIFEIFFPWFRECTVTGCSRTQMLEDLPKTIQALNVDAVELTPTVVNNLLDGRASVPGLKLLLTIGEMLTQKVIDEFGGSETQDSILWAMYGPTEATIHCTLQSSFSATSSINLIGYPLDTVSAFVIALTPRNEAHPTVRVLSVGEVGELAIGGSQIANGYLNSPELTAASFVHHPLYGRLYRTGDRAKSHENGTLELMGRVVTGQVKIRGQRVELGEIEQLIMQVEGCRTSTVIIIDDLLVAFVANRSRKTSQDDVLRMCRRWLPKFMIPSAILLMNSMPQLPSGKIDKGALEVLYRKRLQSNGSTKVGWEDLNLIDHLVLRILQRHLGQDLALESDLAFAGLDSLHAIRIASALRADGCHLSAMDVLSAVTVRDLAATAKLTEYTDDGNQRMQSSSSEASKHVAPELDHWRNMIEYTFPSTPLQEAMLTETITKPKAYCNWVEVELSKPYTFDEIRTAIQALTHSNQILRSGFYPTSTLKGTFVQIVWKNLADSQIRHVKNFSRPYSFVSCESLLRPLSIQVNTCPEKPRMLFQVHHALYDGWSFDLILEDLTHLLDRKAAKKRRQFRDIVRYHTEHQAHNQDTDRRYWADLLRDRVHTSLPKYNGRTIGSEVTCFFAGRSSINVDVLHKRARAFMVNPQVFFQAATAYILSLYTGSQDVVLGNVTSGRTIPVTEVEDIIGPCIASLPFRLQFEGLSQVQDILRATQRLNRESLQHCSLPLRDIAKAAGVHPGARLFDVLFVWQQTLNTVPVAAPSAYVVDSADHSEFVIILEYEPCTEHISFCATFDPTAISEKQIQYLFQQIDEVVQLFLTDTACEVVGITKCFTKSLQSIVNPVPYQRPLEHSLSHAVEQWAMKTPNNEAIVYGRVLHGSFETTDTASYDTLNRRANKLARCLLEHGVDQDQLVSVIMEKSIDLYVAILAVIKTGSGYLPLVPDTPITRVRTILEDAQVSVCISDSSMPTAFLQQLPVCVINLSETDTSSYSDHNLDTVCNGEHLAYAVFTSGSSGTPKGVLVTQHNLMSNLDYLSSVYPYSSTSRLLQSCSQAFDVSVFEIFFSWQAGITLCTAVKDDLFHDLEGAIQQLGVTHLSLTPTVAALVNPDHVPNVEFLVTAGEAVTEHVRRKWAGRGLYQGALFLLLTLPMLTRPSRRLRPK